MALAKTIARVKPRSHRACDGLRWSAMVGSWSIVDHHGASWSPSCVDVRFCGHRRLESQLLKFSKDALRWSASYDRRRSSCDRRAMVHDIARRSYDDRTIHIYIPETYDIARRRRTSCDVAGHRATILRCLFQPDKKRHKDISVITMDRNVTKIIT